MRGRERRERGEERKGGVGWEEEREGKNTHSTHGSIHSSVY